MTSEPALVFRNVRRTFGRTVALDGLDLTVAPGTVLGLVGRNGAGKTTTLRLALGDLWPDSGEVRVVGLDPTREELAVRERVALLSEENHLYAWMTIEEILRFTGKIHPRWDADFAARLVRRLELPLGAKIETLSRGNRVRVALVLAVAARPDLLLLDDPTSGLDPLARREVLEGLLEAILEEGHAVVWASHLVHDLERVADRVAVIDDGRLLLEEDVESLRERVRAVTAVFDGEAPELADLPGRLRLRRSARVIEAIADAPEERLRAALRAAGARTVDFQSLSLEDILVALLGRDELAAARNGGEEVAHA